MQGLTFLAVLVFSSGILAAEHTAPCLAAVCWVVEPTVCVVDKQQAQCEMALTLHWQSQQPRSLCAYLDETQLQCWHQQQQGSWQQTLQLKQNSVLQLREQQQLVLQQSLTILSRQPDRRRRLVAPWSVF